MLSAGAYLAGAAVALGVLALVAVGAWRMRNRLLPEWSGPPARLAEVVLALTVVVSTAQILGGLHAFEPGLVLAAIAAVGAVMIAAGGPSTAPASSRPSTPRWERLLAAAGLAVFAAQWVSHTAFAYGHGMTNPDTLQYHGPFTARFLQTGTFTALFGVGGEADRFYPQNSELVHALVVLPFDRDLLGPAVTLFWAALALLAAWCIGRRADAGALSILGAVAALGLQAVAASNAGQASNDVMCAALLLAAAALLIESEWRPAPLALAGAAAGMALSTRLIALVPAAALTIGVLAVGLARRHGRSALAWCGALAATGCCWFIRNWALTDNPLPWYDLHVGPVHFDAFVNTPEEPLTDYITDGALWRDLFLPGLRRGLGFGWPIVLALGLAGAVLVLLRRRPALERVAAAAALAAFVAYPFTPLTAALGGLSFVFNLRYLCAPLLLAFVLVPLAVAESARARIALAALFSGLAGINALMSHHERVPAWPVDHLVPGVVAGLMVVAVTVVAVRRPAIGSRALIGAGAAALVVALAGGWFLQRYYADHRYADNDLAADAANRYFAGIDDARVALIGSNESFPLFGRDLSNRILTDIERPIPGTLDAAGCRQARADYTGFDYVVFTAFGFARPSPAEDWLETAPGAHRVLRDGVTSVYRLDEPLDPAGCG